MLNSQETPQELVVVLENVEERGNEVDQGMETEKKVAKDFDIEKVVQQNIDFYRSVLSKKNS